MRALYFIVGCTAVGKGAVARELAGRAGAHIISADSMKIYRRMDIGTAKPSPKLRAEIPHYCIDIVEPSESFSVAQFVARADAAVRQAEAAGAVALAVGGTGLYVKALSEGLFDAPGADERVRAELNARAQAEGADSLHAELARIDPRAALRIDPNDRRRIIRALEVHRSTGRAISDLQRQWDTGRMRYDCTFVGLRRDKTDLHRRINARVKRMIDAGLAEEVEALLAEPAGLSDQAARAVGYAEMIAHLRGDMTLPETVERIKINTRRLARKQRTWHRRFRDVHWIDLAPDDTTEKIASCILERVRLE